MDYTNLKIEEADTGQLKDVFTTQKITALQIRSEKVHDRIAILDQIKTWILGNRDQIKQAIFDDFQKPPEEVDLTEIRTVLSEIRHIKKNLPRWTRPQKVDTPLAYLGTKSSILYEPKGVCLIISPWNFPFNLSIGPMVHALAAGNTVIIKPSEFTAHTSNLIRKMCEELFKPDRVAVFEGGPEVSQQLLQLPFDHIFFTGSPGVGKIVMKAASENLSSVTLELGGKSPTIIDQRSNIKDAAEKIAWGKFFNNGQTCIAPDYILIREEDEDAFASALQHAVEKLFNESGKGFEHSPDYARIINHKHFDRLGYLMKDAVDKGANVAFGGIMDEKQKYIAPTLLSKVPEESLVLQEEIFGPILPMVRYDSLDDAIDYINNRPKPLALYLFTKSRKSARSVLKKTTAGTACINDVVIHFSHPNLPFGGVNNSGFGKSHGFYGFQAFSNMKPVLRQRIGFTGLKTLYPPYHKARKLIDFVTRYL